MGLAAAGVPLGDLDRIASEAAAAAGDHPRSGDVEWFRALFHDAADEEEVRP